MLAVRASSPHPYERKKPSAGWRDRAHIIWLDAPIEHTPSLWTVLWKGQHQGTLIQIAWSGSDTLGASWVSVPQIAAITATARETSAKLKAHYPGGQAELADQTIVKLVTQYGS